MRPREFPLNLDTAEDTPLFVQISRALAADIARGRLKPGDALPGTRSLAGSLGVHRSTVVAAYAELVAQGWVATKPGGATYVAASSPEPRPRRFAPKSFERGGAARSPGFPVGEPLVESMPLPQLPRGGLLLWGGSPDLRLLPVDMLARAHRRVTRRRGKSLLAYSSHFAGHPDLRRAVAQLVSSARGLADDPETVLITRGSQMALDLVARAIVRPGDVVCVEALGYRPSWSALERAGARLVGVPVDASGLDVDALARLCAREPIRMLYVTPHHHYPTTVVLTAGRRARLLALARKHRFAILEDDYDHEFHYDGRPVLPLASTDVDGSVFYVGTFSKVMLADIRVGYTVVPESLIETFEVAQRHTGQLVSETLQDALAEFLDDGAFAAHIRRMTRLYRSRRDRMVEALAAETGDVFVVEPPAGGMQVLARCRARQDDRLLCARLAEAGVTARPLSSHYVGEAAERGLFLGFAAWTEREIDAGARLIGRVCGRS